MAQTDTFLHMTSLPRAVAKMVLLTLIMAQRGVPVKGFEMLSIFYSAYITTLYKIHVCLVFARHSLHKMILF